MLALAAILGGCDERPGATARAGTEPVHATAAAGGEFAAAFEAAYLGAIHEAPPDREAGTSFRRSPGLSSAIADEFLASYHPLERATRDAMAGFVRSGRALSEVSGQVRAYGMDPDDVADIIAIHHAIHWAIAGRQVAAPEDVRALRAALAGDLSRRMEQWSNEDRQRLAERHALFTAVRANEYGVLVRRGDADAVRRYSLLVARDFRARTGMDPDRPLDQLATAGD